MKYLDNFLEESVAMISGDGKTLGSGEIPQRYCNMNENKKKSKSWDTSNDRIQGVVDAVIFYLMMS